MDKDYLLKKWLNNDLTEAEKKAFSKIDDYEFNQQLVEDAKLFKASNFSKATDFQDFKTKYESNKQTSETSSWLKPLLRVAAVLVIALGVYFTFFSNNLTEYNTLASEKITFELPDASEVTLNALTEIKFDEKNWKDERSLQLKGEAYFKVAKGKKFDVNTRDGIVTVVGTQFNVKQREDYFEVKCFEGIVRVTASNSSEELTEGEAFRIINGKPQNRMTANSEPQWIRQMSVFDAVPFKEVLAEMERQYSIQISYDDVEINRVFTGGFEHDNLDNALISITQPMSLTYKFSTSNQVKIHGEKN